MRGASPVIAVILIIVLIAPVSGQVAEGAEGFTQFEIVEEVGAQNQIDTVLLQELRRRGIEPANLCSDAVFVRRVHLDLIGSLPEPRTTRSFLANYNPDKRARLIDTLLEHENFADYWSMKWCDLLRVKAEFPINLWPNAVQAYHRWVHDSLANNLPYDRFARGLLTSSGSNFRVPQVNFYRAVQGKKPSAIASAVALTFMGSRLAAWPEKRRLGMEAFFSRVGFKGTAEWKEEIVCLDHSKIDVLRAIFPDGVPVEIQPGQDPRVVFADWLISPGNDWFTTNIVNRVWSWLLGRGLIHEPDDIRQNNPAVHPQVLEYLEEFLVEKKYDLKEVYRLILNSRTYQQSSLPRSGHAQAEALFAHYGVRRMDAEVLIDALCWISGARPSYSSPIPEPFTFIPEEHRSIELADGSITSQFLEMFGRPSRDTGLESERNNQPTDAQRLHLLNSSFVQTRIARSNKIRGMLRNARGNRRKLIKDIYVTILSRFPTDAEQAATLDYFRTSRLGLRQGTIDLVWALINTKEFLYRH